MLDKLFSSAEPAEVVHSNLDVVLSYLSISGIISLETILAVVSSLIFSYMIFIILRRYPPVTAVILPGLELTLLAHDRALKLLRSDKMTTSERSFVSTVVIAYALRGAASLLVVAWIFATMVSIVAPLF